MRFGVPQKLKEDPSPGYQLFMLALCLYALAVLAMQTAKQLEPSTVTILDYVDYLVCAAFFGDFVWNLARAKSAWRYFITWGWLDLLSSLPMFDIARWGRVARVLRIFRVLRGLRASKHLAAVVLKQRAENTMLAASLVALMLVTFCSIAILHFENVADANILTADDAIWWAFATITTVGYGDRYPTTTEGRMVAVVLMSAGVALFGTFSAYLAKWFIGPEVEESSEKELAALRIEIVALRDLIERNSVRRSDR